MDDDDLLAAVAEGDRAAFAALYDHWVRPVFSVVQEVVSDRACTEEVTRDVFVEIWRQAPSVDARHGTLAPWIMVMALRRALATTDPALDLVTRPPGPDRRLGRAIGELTGPQREAIELAFYGGHTVREVSDLLDTPLATVRTCMRDGLVHLRAALGVRGDRPA